MAQTDHFIPSDEIHPIDIVEAVAAHHEWDFDRLADDQIAMVVEGQWRSYSLTLAWSPREEVLPPPRGGSCRNICLATCVSCGLGGFNASSGGDEPICFVRCCRYDEYWEAGPLILLASTCGGCGGCWLTWARYVHQKLGVDYFKASYA